MITLCSAVNGSPLGKKACASPVHIVIIRVSLILSDACASPSYYKSKATFSKCQGEEGSYLLGIL